MTINKYSDRYWQLCLIVTLIAPVFYSLLDIQTAFQGDWIVQDDARQHVFWMMRYIDPQLFPNDLIADYFQSVAPLGYTFFYKIAAKTTGIDPLVLNKLIPLILRLVITYYFFLLCRSIFPIPISCVISTLLFNHNIWLKDDIVSATPRAFLYPFLIAFLYYFTKQYLLPCLITIVLLSLFYPQTVLLVSGILVLNLIKWRGFIPTLINDKKQLIFSLIGLTVAILVMLPYAIKTSEYAPIITRAEALSMAEFHYGGRSNFFKDSIFEYIVGRGNGVMISTAVFKPIILLSGLFLPLVIKNNKFVLAQKITPNINTLIKLLIASLGMYTLAHLFLFRLHLPSRYTTHSLRITVTIFAGITITIVLDYLHKKLRKKFSYKKSQLLFNLVIIVLILTTYSDFFDYHSPTGYKNGSYGDLYQFFKQQPKDIMIASLTKESDNLPTFAKRSVLVSREYAIPYQLGFYKPFSQKVRDLITAQYSSNLQTVKEIIRKYNITYWLIEEKSFTTEYVVKNRWLKQYRSEYEQAIANLQSNEISVIAAYKEECIAFSTSKFTVIDTECIVNSD